MFETFIRNISYFFSACEIFHIKRVFSKETFEIFHAHITLNLGATVINVYLQRLDDGDETLSNVSSSSITSSSMLSSVWPTVVLVLVLAANFCILPARPLIVRVAEFWII
jgi:hypothetical protein